MATRQMTFLREAAVQNAAVPKLTTGERKLDFLYAEKSEEIKNRGGAAGAAEYLGASALAGVGGILEGTYDVVVGGISALAGNQAYAENLFGTNRVGEWHKNIEDGYNPNGALKFAGDVTTGLGQSATMLIPGVGVPLFFAGVSGQGVGTAVEKTGELGAREWIYGGVSGAVEGTLEYVLGAAGQVAGKVAKTGGKNIITRIASPIAKTWAASGVWKGVTKDMISAGAGEFMEEFLAEYIDVALQRVTGVDKEASTTLGQALYAGAVGFVSGAAMGGVASGINTALTYNAGKRAIENGNADRIVRDAHTVIDNLKLDKTSETNEALKRLKSSLESYELATNKNSDAATVYLGEVQGYMAMVEASWAVNKRAAQLTSVSEDGALAYAKVMSYYDGRAKVEQNYTAQDWFDDKNKIRTRYAAIEWTGAFFSDSEEMRQSATFDAAIAADREGRAAGTPVTPDISGAVWTGESGTYNISVGDEAQYMRVMKLSDGSYSIAVGDNSMTAQGYRGLTAEQAQAEFERIKGAVTNAAQNQNLKAQAATDNNVNGKARVTDGMYANIPTGQVSENLYTVQQMNAARRAVKNFDMQSADVKARVLRWMQSVEGKGIDADVVSGIANVIRLRPDLQVMLAETKEGVAGFHTPGVAGRNLIVLSEGKDVSLLRETIAHELGHELEGEAGYKEIKEAALAATKQTDIDEWRELYKGYDDVDAEIAAKALGRRLATPRFVERFANRSIIRRAIDFGKMLLDALWADDAGRLEIAETEKLIDMMNRALQNANVQVRGENAGKRYNITAEDLSALRKFGRKSVNELAGNPEFIRVAEKWARKFYSADELGPKSPFFRAWFGDWRAYDTKTRKNYVDVNSKPIQPNNVSRESVVNQDTKWVIEVNRDGIDETANKNGKWSIAYHSLKNIQEMLAESVLIDTVVVNEPSKRMGKEAVFVHHLYCPVKVNGLNGIAKLYVVENYQDRKHFYLSKIEMVPSDSTGLNAKGEYVPNSSEDTDISIAEIYEFVKTHDKDFEKDSENPVYFNPKPVSREVLNADGTPKVFYHGSDELFTTFGYDKIGSATGVGILGEGFYFTDQQKLGKKYGKNVYKVFLQMSNPYMASQEDLYRLNTAKLEKQGYDGVILKAPNGNIYMALDNTQIKSATDNIGTFDRSNPDIRYNLTPEAAEQAARDAAEVEAFRNAEDAESARVRQAELEFDISSKAERAAFDTEITRAEVSAKDNNSRWFPWADVKRDVTTIVKEYGLSGDTARYAAFVVHRAFNGFRASDASAGYSERRANMIGSLVDYIIDAADGGNTAGRWRDERRAEIERKLNDAYNSLGKETQRQKARERVENAEERARAAINGSAIAPLLDRVRMRRFRTKTAGKIDQKAFGDLVSLAQSIRPKYQVNLQNAAAFLDDFYSFASQFANESMAYAANPASEDLRRAYNDAKGSNPVLNYVDYKLASLLQAFHERESAEWTEGDYEVLKVALERLLAIDARFDKQYNADGTFGETSEVADKVMTSLHKKYNGKVSGTNLGGIKSFFSVLTYNSLEPEAAVRLMENAAGQHIMSRMINTIKFATEAAKSDERKWLKAMEDFKTENKKWWKEWNEGDVVFKYSLPDMGGKIKTHRIVMTKDEAASFYMTSKRHQAKAALALGRVEIADAMGRKGEQYRSRMVDGLTEAQIDELLSMGQVAREDFILKCENAMDIAVRNMYKSFSAEDRQYIALIENFYATTSKQEKRDMDTRLFGSTNVFDGYYYPISRSAMNRDMDLSSSFHDLDDVSTRGYTFNKSTIQGAKSKLTIRGATEVTTRHARQLAMYKHLTMPLQNLQRLYNYKADKSTAGTQSVREYISKYAWNGFETYLGDYFKDVQGMSRRVANDAPSRFVRHLQSGYVKFQLGGNLKSMIKQFGSAINMLSVADFDVWYKGLNPETIFSKGAKADMVKYSTIAGNRVDSNEIYYASGAVGTVDKISDMLMKHLEWGDTGANLIMWSMAQHAIAKEKGLAVGTKENKQLAGKLLDDYIMKVQDTSGAATKSAYARSPQVLVQGMTLFTSSPTKMFSRLLVSSSEYFELKRMQKDGSFGAAEQERLGKLEKDALKTAGKVGGAIVAAAVFESVINLAWNALRGKDDDEDKKLMEKVALEVGTNMVGIIPLVGTAAESLLSGYDVSNLYIDIYNDGLGAIRNTYTMTANLAAGKAVSQRDIIKNLRSIAYFGGQVTGIPVRNINSLITAALNTVSDTAAYEYDQLFYEPAYSADLKKAVEAGNERLVSSIVDLTLKERTGTASSCAADEVVRLAMAGYTVMPKAVPQAATVDGAEIALTRKQQAAFKEIYSDADSAVIGLMATEQFAELSDELRAKAVKVTYDIYHSRAKANVLGSELSVMAALSYLNGYIDVPTLVAESAYVYGIKSTPEATRSELVRQYLAGYSPQAQAILLYAAGYRSEKVKQELSNIVATLEEEIQNQVKKTLDF